MNSNNSLVGQHIYIVIFILAFISPSPAQETIVSRNPNIWKAEIAAIEENDEQPVIHGGVLFYGSSSIRLWDLKRSFPKLDAVNHGFGGSEISDCIHFADRMVIKHRPRTLVFYAGDNDIAGGKSAEQVHADFQRFVQTLRENIPEVKIVYIAIKPSINRWSYAEEMRKANGLIASSCKKDRLLEFVNIWEPMLGKDGLPNPSLFVEDGLHMNDEGYKLWSDLIGKQVQ